MERFGVEVVLFEDGGFQLEEEVAAALIKMGML